MTLERKFKVIKGGLGSPVNGDKTFINAYVTDTRLMGVVGLYIHWELEAEDLNSEFHQFFYFDTEEFGFETYKSIVGNDPDEIDLVESTLFGGLGGRKIKVTEEEACYLVKEYAEKNKKLGLAMPGDQEEYRFILERRIEFTAKQRSVLMFKMCDDIVSDYQVINYFLMRCFGHDYTAAKFLTNTKVPVEIYSDIPMATFCKNTIDDCDGEEGTYMCESLIEFGNTYHLVISEVKVEDYAIVDFRRHNSFKISAAEAAMMLSRAEFVTVYDLLTDNTEFIENSLAGIIENSMVTVHESGKMHLMFNADNSHVNQKVFRLNEDVHGMFFISEYGQLIISSYDIRNILEMEYDLRKSPLSEYLMMKSKYEFKEPVMYEFIHSDFEDFDDFIDFIRD